MEKCQEGCYKPKTSVQVPLCSSECALCREGDVCSAYIAYCREDIED